LHISPDFIEVGGDIWTGGKQRGMIIVSYCSYVNANALWGMVCG
jgi:hypothetical protein